VDLYIHSPIRTGTTFFTCRIVLHRIISEYVFSHLTINSRAHRVSGYRSRGPGLDSRRFQIFREAVGLERGPLSLVSITEELLGRNSSGSGQENRKYDRGDPLR
jgi:hypothetical protein